MSAYEPPQPPPPPPPPPPPTGAGGYSAGTAWTYGWGKLVSHLGPILLAVLVLVVVQAVFYGLNYVVRDSLFATWLISLASWIVSMIITAGLVRGALDIAEGRPFEAATVVTPRRLGEVIVASVLIGLATFVGIILLVIPGLLVIYFTSFTLFFLMDRPELGAIDAIKASFRFTKDNAGNVILWFLLCVVTYVIGICLCGVGLLAAIPVILIGTAYTYKVLNNEPVAA